MEQIVFKLLEWALELSKLDITKNFNEHFYTPCIKERLTESNLDTNGAFGPWAIFPWDLDITLL